MSDFHAAWANENVKAAEEVCGLLGLRGTPVEPPEAPAGQDVSQDRQDSDETSADTNPCMCALCLPARLKGHIDL